ncbi:MAG: hypothetical protein ACJ76S_02155 [Solirubrobacteraceae bacterium]|jgi:hypothetical protein
MTTIASFTLSDGAWVFIGIFVASLLSIAYGYYTRRGSAINQRAHGSVYSDAPGARTPSVLSHDQSAARRLVGRGDERREPRRSSSDETPRGPLGQRRAAKQD